MQGQAPVPSIEKTHQGGGDGSDVLARRLERVQDLKAAHPALTVLLRSDPDFAATEQCYILRPGAASLAVARPRSAEQVSALVRFCTSHDVPFVIRAGGHDCCGRTHVADALMIDLREINHVHIGEHVEGGQRTARVGGGCLTGALLGALEGEGLVTPVSNINAVGYVGWAVYGGYGPLTALYGMGLDQIVGAKVVTAAGEVVEADEGLLKGIRGAAGALGVVVEVKIKVYPLRKILAGNVVWATGDDHPAFLRDYLRNLQQLYADGMPRELTPLLSVWDSPQYKRTAVMMTFWASEDHDEGRRWIARVEALGSSTPVINNVRPCTLREGLESSDASVPLQVYGSGNTVTIRGLSDTLVDILAEHTGRFGASCIGACLHRFVGPGDVEDGSSVWGPRERHTVLELISQTTDRHAAEAASAWASGVKAEIEERMPGEVVGGGWLPFLPLAECNWEKIFGKEFQYLVELKRKWDPENVFRNGLPRISVE